MKNRLKSVYQAHQFANFCKLGQDYLLNYQTTLKQRNVYKIITTLRRKRLKRQNSPSLPSPL